MIVSEKKRKGSEVVSRCGSSFLPVVPSSAGPRRVSIVPLLVSWRNKRRTPFDLRSGAGERVWKVDESDVAIVGSGKLDFDLALANVLDYVRRKIWVNRV